MDLLFVPVISHACICPAYSARGLQVCLKQGSPASWTYAILPIMRGLVASCKSFFCVGLESQPQAGYGDHSVAEALRGLNPHGGEIHTALLSLCLWMLMASFSAPFHALTLGI